ncbi:unnamed protein product [Parnassius apollo]|uniref:(apollo) hypothetical protein n=1 Tax=Parnassius apollo TaxID=110799 RepID=A0A8S3X2P3_PARAO|nr:unnamed protein product [Parnassius apollo]
MSDLEDDPDCQPSTDEESERESRCSDHSSSKESTELPAKGRQQQDNNTRSQRMVDIPSSDGSRKKQFPFTAVPAKLSFIGNSQKEQERAAKRNIKRETEERRDLCNGNNDGVLVLRWKDKRDVLALSTRHRSGFVNVRSRRNRKTK